MGGDDRQARLGEIVQVAFVCVPAHDRCRVEHPPQPFGPSQEGIASFGVIPGRTDHDEAKRTTAGPSQTAWVASMQPGKGLDHPEIVLLPTSNCSARSERDPANILTAGADTFEGPYRFRMWLTRGGTGASPGR
jgi:hypothetical protein